MGSGKTKKHESFAVAVADPPPPPDGLEAASAEAATILTPLIVALSEDYDSPVEEYAAISDVAETTLDQILYANSDVFKVGLADLRHETQAWLAGKTEAELQEMASAAGFEHPTLVGLTSHSQHPLVHALDPAYPDDTESKTSIQDLANDRYDVLVAGETVAGQTLADVQSAEAALAAKTGAAPAAAETTQMWDATPSEAMDAVAAFQDAHAAYKGVGNSPMSETEAAAILRNVIDSENTLATARCDEISHSLTNAQAAAKTLTDTELTDIKYYVAQGIPTLAAQLRDEGTISDNEAALLSRQELVALARKTTPTADRDVLAATADARADQVLALTNAHQKFNEAAAKDWSGKYVPGSAADAGTYAQAAKTYMDARGEVADWYAQAISMPPDLGISMAASAPWKMQETTTAFRAWAKNEKLAALRAAAATCGLENAQAATRAQTQNYLASHWDSHLDAAQIQAAVTAKAGPKPSSSTSSSAATLSLADQPKTVTAASSPLGQTSTSLSTGATKTGTADGVLSVVQGYQASHAAVPQRLAQKKIDDAEFVPVTYPHPGGAHTKTFHAGPDGTVWMAKPDNSAGGTRALSEAAASQIYNAAGVPAPPVYAKKVNGKLAAVQPMLENVAPLSTPPGAMNQADVDTLVRMHVAGWAVGEHDQSPQNILRTGGGALVPCDNGQAFKFWGKDKLDVGYTPNASYGSKPAWHQVYEAAKTSGLAPGVKIRPEVALSAIKAIESIPDAEYAEMLRPVADRGANTSGDVHWRSAMEKVAKKRLGKTEVTPTEIADEFIRHGLERRAELRSDFATFFDNLGHTNAIGKVT